MKFSPLRFLNIKQIAIFMVVIFAALSAYSQKTIPVSEISEFDSMNDALTMRYVEVISPRTFLYFARLISPDDHSPKKLNSIRRYHVGVERATNRLIVYKKRSQTVVAIIPVSAQTVSRLKNALVLVNKSKGPVKSSAPRAPEKWTDLISEDLSTYVDLQSSLPEYMPLDSRKRGFGIEQKVDGGSISVEASQTLYRVSTESLTSSGQSASLILKQSVGPHTEASFEVTHNQGGMIGDDTAAMAVIRIHGD